MALTSPASRGLATSQRLGGETDTRQPPAFKPVAEMREEVTQRDLDLVKAIVLSQHPHAKFTYFTHEGYFTPEEMAKGDAMLLEEIQRYKEAGPRRTLLSFVKQGIAQILNNITLGLLAQKGVVWQMPHQFSSKTDKPVTGPRALPPPARKGSGGRASLPVAPARKPPPAGA